MKKLVLSLVVLSFVLMGCPNPVSEQEVEKPIDDRFEGTWVQRGYNNDGNYYNILQFSGSHFVFKATTYGIEFSGPYSYTETTITFNPDVGWIWDKSYIPWTSNYEIVEDMLHIENVYASDGAMYPIGGYYTK